MRYVIDIENADFNLFDTIEQIEVGGPGLIECFEIDTSMEGQMYTELTDADFTINLFKVVHEAIVDSITQDEDRMYTCNSIEVLELALKNLKAKK
jgi:hypothetical protein